MTGFHPACTEGVIFIDMRANLFIGCRLNGFKLKIMDDNGALVKFICLGRVPPCAYGARACTEGSRLFAHKDAER
jgi:hypothetical protein